MISIYNEAQFTDSPDAAQIVRIYTDANLAAVQSAGWLNGAVGEGFVLSPKNKYEVSYNSGANVDFFNLSVVKGVYTLSIACSLQTAQVSLTAAQVLAMYATPQLIVAAPSSAQALVVVDACLYTNVSTAFTSGGVAVLQYGATANGAGTNALSATIPAAEVTAAASQIYVLPGNTASALTAISGVALYLSNQTQAFATGTGSTLAMTVQYYIVPATV